MKTGGTYYFRRNPAKLQEMLVLRSRGYSYNVLAHIYECPKIAIRFLVRKNNLAEDAVQPVLDLRIVRKELPHTTRVKPMIVGTIERINPGKTYAEYLQEDRKRRLAHDGFSSSAKK